MSDSAYRKILIEIWIRRYAADSDHLTLGLYTQKELIGLVKSNYSALEVLDEMLQENKSF